jgi:hypothetical protein
MAYLSTVEYDTGGRIRTLEGEVRFDDGGRVRTLLGHGDDGPPHLGQDEVLPLTSSDTWTPLVTLPAPASTLPSPNFPDNWYQPTGPVSLDTFGSLTPPPPLPPGTVVDLPATPPAPFHPDLPFGTASAPITGTLTPPVRPAPAAPSTVNVSEASGVIASVGNLFKSIFGGSTAQASSQHLVPTSGTVTPAGQVLAATGQLRAGSWFTDPAQEMIGGVPNWVSAGGAVLIAAALFSGGRESTRYSVRRRRNPAELILMGANPSRRRRMR